MRQSKEKIINELRRQNRQINDWMEFLFLFLHSRLHLTLELVFTSTRTAIKTTRSRSCHKEKECNVIGNQIF